MTDIDASWQPVVDGWPDPIQVLNEDGQSDIVLLCEHGSNHVPPYYARLGLSRVDLDRHIAWDIGAAAVTAALSAMLDAPAFLGTYSRLLIDLNRPVRSADSIPVRSEDTDIPGNLGLSMAERARRVGRIFEPYHRRVGAHLDRRVRDGQATRIVAMHSFTPVFHGIRRPWDAGVLFGSARGFGGSVLAGVRGDDRLRVEANEPYVISRDGDYAIPVHGDDRGIPAVLIEVRQDLLTTPSRQRAWAQRIGTALLSGPGNQSPQAIPDASGLSRKLE